MDVSKEIAYSYAVFVPTYTKRVISKMKTNVSLSDRKFLKQTLQNSARNDLVFPYDVLNSNLEKHIVDFYDEIGLSSQMIRKLDSYGNRGEEFKKEFNQQLYQSKTSLISSIKQELTLQMMQNKDVKSAIAHIEKILTKRLLSLENFLKSSAGQLERYMLLWDYQDDGYTHYRIKANGSNCEDCTRLDGKVFSISEVESGKNFIPFHPNCDCFVEVLDESGNTAFVVPRNIERGKDSDSLEYLQTSLKQIFLGNYTEEANMLGTLGQVVLGILGLDAPGDIRDLIYDVTNFEMSVHTLFRHCWMPWLCSLLLAALNT